MTTKSIVRMNKNGGANITYKNDKGEVKVDFSFNSRTEDMGDNLFPDLQKKYTDLVITVSKNGKKVEKESVFAASEYNHEGFSRLGSTDLLENLDNVYYNSMVWDAGDNHVHEESPTRDIIVHAAIDIGNYIKANQKILAQQKAQVK